jgi:Fic family protein
MSEQVKNEKKEALKQLRKQRSSTIERIRKMNKAQNADIKNISEQLQTGSKTVPEIAKVIDMPSSQVLLYLAGLMEYGFVAEGEKDGDYFRYELVDK